MGNFFCSYTQFRSLREAQKIIPRKLITAKINIVHTQFAVKHKCAFSSQETWEQLKELAASVATTYTMMFGMILDNIRT